MKRSLFIITLIFGIFFLPQNSFAQINDTLTPKGVEIKLLKSFQDSVAYAYGTMIADQLIKQGIDLEMLKKGLDHKFAKKPLLTLKESQACVQKSEKIRKKESKKIENARIKSGEIFLSKNKALPGVGSTPSGLQYKILKQGEGKRPSLNDKVKVHYEGKRLDGTVFNTTILKDPMVFEMMKVIKGWQEGLQLMNEGSQFQFYIPSKLAYGSRGYDDIPPGALLIFTVELIEVIEKEKK